MASEATSSGGPTSSVKDQPPRKAAEEAEKNTTKELLEEGDDEDDEEDDEDFVSVSGVELDSMDVRMRKGRSSWKEEMKQVCRQGTRSSMLLDLVQPLVEAMDDPGHEERCSHLC